MMLPCLLPQPFSCIFIYKDVHSDFRHPGFLHTQDLRNFCAHTSAVAFMVLPASCHLDGEILYRLRCSLLHEDSLPKTLRISKDKRLIDEFVLVANEDYNNEGLISVSYNSDGTVAKRRMEINIILLCRRLCSIAKKYYEENKDKFDFLEFSFVDRLEWKRNVEKLKNKYSS